MGWNNFADQGNSGSKADWIQEGNIEVLVIKSEKIRVKFLTEDYSIEDIMRENKLTREMANEYINTDLLYHKWIMPVSLWEHSIPSIQNVRYFTTKPCQGRKSCIMCAENEKAKNNGISENKLLPFPVRRRFIIPAYVYKYKKVLFIKQTEKFFATISAYIESHGSNISFDIYKVGKGFNTEYNSIFIGPAEDFKEVCGYPLPSGVDFKISDEEINKAIKGGGVQQTKQQSEGQQSDQQNQGDGPGDFVIPFGTHKNKSIKEVYEMGDMEYLNFISENSSGLVCEKVNAFLKEIK